MEAAVKSFAEKGFHATSIQEIADRLGIAKGALYFYFKSKEDLLVSICSYYIEQFQKEYLQIVEDPGLTARDRITEQVKLHFRQFSENKDFITLLMHERFEVTEDIRRMLIQLRTHLLLGNQRAVLELYGEDAKAYSFDAATMFNSMLDGYFSYLIFNQKQLDVTTTLQFLMDRLDDIVHGMINKRSTPLLNVEEMEQLLTSTGLCAVSGNQDALRQIAEIRIVLGRLELEDAVRDEIESSLSILESELSKPISQAVMVKGMISLLKSHKINEIKKLVAKLESSV